VIRFARAWILRPLGHDTLRSLLTVVSVMLGVAVVVAIELAGEAAAGSFRSSLESLTGHADFAITANGGVDEAWAGRLAGIPRNLSFFPVLERQVLVPGTGDVTLVGLDFVPRALEESAAADGESRTGDCELLPSSALARRLRLQPRQSLRLAIGGRPRDFVLGRALDAGEAEFLALDIACTQHALGDYGRVDRIDVTLERGEDPEAAELEMRGLLPESYSVEKAGARREENLRMLRAFRWNLRVLSYISLVVGAFFIYNTISVSVVRRRGEIGILRALGASRALVFSLFLGEAVLLASAGSASGILLGRWLAWAVVRLISETVSVLYLGGGPGPVMLTPGAWLAGMGGGVGLAVLSALAPARQAAFVAPAEAMSRGAHEHKARVEWRRDLAIAAGFALAALLCSFAPALDGRPVAGYAAAFLSIGAAAMASPALVLAVTRAGRRLTLRLFGVEGLLAGRSLAGSLARTSVIVAALATAIAMMASVAVMVGSFRETVAVWLDSQLRADLFIRPASSGGGRFSSLPGDLPGLLAAIPGVESVDRFHALELRFRGTRATLAGADVSLMLRYGRLRFLPGQNRERVLRSLRGAARAILSEPFARKFGVWPGSRIQLPLGGHVVDFEVAGVYYDYSSERGFVIVDRSTLLGYLPGQPVTNIALFLRPGAVADRVRGDVQRAVAGRGIEVIQNAALRRNAIRVFDRTFAVTWALEGIAIAIAMLGAANSLLALALDRRREIGLLRFLGASADQVRRIVLIEAAFLGLFGSLLGLGLGGVLSLLLIYVVNVQSFGWTIQFYPPAALVFGATALVWAVTVLAACYPAHAATRLDPLDAMHAE
jgi:putative ABC transport system permease protein